MNNLSLLCLSLAAFLSLVNADVSSLSAPGLGVDGLPIPGAGVGSGLPIPGAGVGSGLPSPGAGVGSGLPRPGAGVGSGLPIPSGDVSGLPSPGGDVKVLPSAGAGVDNGSVPKGGAARRSGFIPKPIAKPKGKEADLKFACSLAKDKQFCIQTIHAHPESRGADLPRLVSVSLQLARSKGMDISDSLDDMLQDEETLPRDLDEALNDCSDQFSDALSQLEDTTNGLSYDPAPFNDMRTWLAGALNNAEICKRGLLDVKPQNRRNTAALPIDHFAKLCDVAVSCVTVMQTVELKSGEALTLRDE
ncbi:hypothetical protein V2J09_016075 [Rumex salicifolius]